MSTELQVALWLFGAVFFYMSLLATAALTIIFYRDFISKETKSD